VFERVDLVEGGLLTSMVREVLQTILEVELADDFGYEPYDAAGRARATRATARIRSARVDIRVRPCTRDW
jgi:hypothetical protein